MALRIRQRDALSQPSSESAYGALFALGTIVKIVVVPFLAR
ncbi:hypothetical protein [Austwickia sp. TVS 96-490-7B]|nr:hypothetical protein [Austwickia sp. TVS 96-490-7B]